MSRSYRKTPGWVDRNPFGKNQANRRVRRTPNVPDGKVYRKFYQMYDICDYKMLYYGYTKKDEQAFKEKRREAYKAWDVFWWRRPKSTEEIEVDVQDDFIKVFHNNR